MPSGHRALVRQDYGLAKRELGGKPPYSISIGNHKAVVLRADGQPVDLRPHFTGSIVRFNFDPRASAAD